MRDVTKEMYAALGIRPQVLEFGEKILEGLKERFEEIDAVTEYNQMKVISAMQKNQLSDIHFAATTGYGYNDIGRDVLEAVYADIFKTEAALVRSQFVSGTHSADDFNL